MSEEQAEAIPKKNAEQRFTDGFISEVIEAVRNNTAPWQQSWPSGLVAPYNAVKAIHTVAAMPSVCSCRA
ncbi:hypothetical protein [uncultured Cardiobacterium sp.]|uniref:hypothetical protein n=1 Tax=uncultured Cardiobacterium sp. TaxID=417619 RepID=UPI0026377683|nr:hypothetical protein [uncultured Cardiobacterium sp.]